MDITEKLNEIEAKTKNLIWQAEELERNKAGLQSLLECEVHDHSWDLQAVVSNLRRVFHWHIVCGRCGAWASSKVDGEWNVPIMMNEDLLTDIIGEEEE